MLSVKAKLLVIFRIVSNIWAIAAKLVAAANEALTAASSESPDILTALNTLGPKAAMLYKSLINVGSIASQNPKVCSPDWILTSLVVVLVDQCRTALTPTDAQQIADHRVYLLQILLRLQVKNKKIPDLDIYLAEFLSIFEEPLSWDFLNRQLYSYRNQFKNYDNAIDAFFNELRGKRSFEQAVYGVCFLKHVVLSKNFNNLPVMAFAFKLHNELIKLTYLAATCATVRYKEEAKDQKWMENMIVKDVTLIATHVSRYLNNSLVSAWPHMHNGMLKEQILMNTANLTFVDQNQLKIIANITRSLLVPIGLPNYAYDILITQAADRKYESYFEGTETHCYFNKRDNGFDTIISRIPLNSADDYEKLGLVKIIEKQRAAATSVNQTIQTEMNNLYADRTLPINVDSLKKKIGKDILLDYKFSCWAIIREWQWMPCPEIIYGSSSYNVNDLESITALSYKNKGSIGQDCEEFRFFFFV
ncbi:hypothetical protein B9Z55_025748 [Caenorhabditis nigoni]|uniref:Uncharacterized protein n=1 Tax=Caenorhabditis nigoni TaxID=1611254 RepID=A0A2G5T012_9PELO|nr:hypothetical protein B9Z55_025748 [Caenorhabditis nigoni]